MPNVGIVKLQVLIVLVVLLDQLLQTLYLEHIQAILVHALLDLMTMEQLTVQVYNLNSKYLTHLSNFIFSLQL